MIQKKKKNKAVFALKLFFYFSAFWDCTVLTVHPTFMSIKESVQNNNSSVFWDGLELLNF